MTSPHVVSYMRYKTAANIGLVNQIFSKIFPEGTDTKEPFAESPLVFSPKSPSCFYPHEGEIPFRGQTKAKQLLDVKIHGLGPDARFKALMSGPAGIGKTTLAWIVAKRIQDQRRKSGAPTGRFFEILPAQMQTKEDLDEFMAQLLPYDIVFIDEIHILKNNVGAEPLYHTLADTGNPRYPLGKGKGWIDVPPTVSWLGATTEPGELDGTTGGALRRRLDPEIRLEPPTTDDLVQIVQDQGTPITPTACYAIANRSGGLPWQALSLFQVAKDFASYESKPIIDDEVASKTFEMVGVDEHGLFREDHEVIAALLASPYRMATGIVRYKMSEVALCAATGIDKATYKTVVQPRLLRLGIITTMGGQSLTDKAVTLFKNKYT